MAPFVKSSKALTLCFILAISSLVPSPAKGEGPIVFDLGDCIARALEHNRKVEAGHETVKKAFARIKETKALAWPEVKANADYTYVGDVKNYAFGPNAFAMEQDNYRLGLTLDQKLYAPEVFEAVKASKSYAGQAEMEFEIIRADVVTEVKKAYYYYLYTKTMIVVTEESVAQLERHASDVKTRYEVGLATDFDVLRAEVQLANSIPALTRNKNAFVLAEKNLKSQLAMEKEETVLIEGALQYASMEITIDEALELAFSKRPEIAFLDYSIKNLEQSVEVSRKEAYPSLSMNGSYSYANDDMDIRGEAQWGTSWTVGLSLKATLFDGWGNKARIAQKSSDVKRGKIEKNELMSTIDIEVRTALSRMAEVRELIQSQEKNIENAARAFEIAETGNLNGVVSELEVLDAQLALTQARSNYKEAVYDWLIARTELERAMGTVLLNWQ
ncbi:MAG: TolC family protein [Deltaproteobacteria bacterium]|nr:TolC family protein [Deltaproteobacteria bacterium]